MLKYKIKVIKVCWQVYVNLSVETWIMSYVFGPSFTLISSLMHSKYFIEKIYQNQSL